MLIGEATVVAEPDEKLAALYAIVEHIVLGRWRDVRPPTANELKATSVLAIPIEQASAKVRTGPPLDDEEDYDLEAWAGVIPLTAQAGEPEADPRMRAGIATPPYVTGYGRPARG